MKKLFKKMYILLIGSLFFVAMYGSLGMSSQLSFVQSELADSTGVAISTEVATPMRLCTPAKPEILKLQNPDVGGGLTYFDTYNCFAAFPIKNMDTHTMDIHMGWNNGSFSELVIPDVPANGVYRYIAVPTNGTTCYPTHYLVSAFCPACKTRSSINAIIINEYESGYNAKSRYEPIAIKTIGEIPTSYDQAGSIWDHGGSAWSTLCFSIAYNGMVGEGVVQIPFLGTKTSTVTVNGVEFSVRTGPNRLSVKASSTVTCNPYTTVFGFAMLED